MKFLTTTEAAARLGITTRRIQQMCKYGEIPGVLKQGRTWLIPDSMIQNIDNGNNDFTMKLKPLPIGISDFKTATDRYYYVDKTLLIRDFLDSRPMVSLFTRPRRFGKTLNMDMLRVFFEKTEEDTSKYFKNKMIWKCGKEYTDYQGKYPVIFLTFKDVKCTTWNETMKMIRKLISIEFLRHVELYDSPALNSFEQAQYHSLADATADEIDYQMSLQFLSIMLHKHHGMKTIIIIDEYDTPIQQGHSCNFYDEIVTFMRNFFSGGLKDNSHLEYGFLTGILRVAKESIFSGLNNLSENSIFDERFSQYFGFTHDEIEDMMIYYGKDNKIQEVCEWYDGYQFGGTEIFNPWSVINYLDKNCVPRAYWISTANNDVIREIIVEATPEIKENLHYLMQGKSIVSYIDTAVIYPEIGKNPHTIYSFLLMTGYLKLTDMEAWRTGNAFCEVAIPNKEIFHVYEKEILSVLEPDIPQSTSMAIQQAIFSGDAHKLQSLLESYMLQSLSVFDTANEGFYHGMMLGLCAVMSSHYQVRSNRESGLGRFDIALIPCTKTLPGFIYEFKYTNDEKTDLSVLADDALHQIEDKHYDTELLAAGVTNIIKIGIAFRGKNAIVKNQ